MSYESDRSGAGVVIAIAVALVVVVIGCLLVAVAGLFLFRASAVRTQEAIVAREAALVKHQELLARAQAEEIAIQAEPPATSELTIALDAEGNLQLNGVATDLDQLQRDLQQRVENTTVGSVVIHAAAESKVEDLLKVVSTCMESGATDLQIHRNP